MYLWRLIGTSTFEFSCEGEPPGALVDRRQIVESLTGAAFPLDGVCPVVTKGHAGDVEWEWLGEVDPQWEKHPLDCLNALTMEWYEWFQGYRLRHDYKEISAVLSRHIKKGY